MATAMRAPDWRGLVPLEGVLRELDPDGDRVVLWLPGDLEGGYRNWEQVASLPRAEVIAVGEGVSATAATSTPARQRVGGVLGKLFPGRRGPDGDRSWTLPDGGSAEPAGERRADLLLAWADDGSDLLDESRAAAIWPENRGLRRIGANLILVSGVEPPRPGRDLEETPPDADPLGCPRARANGLLAEARASGDRRREASAIADLGVIDVNEGETLRGLKTLGEALAIAHESGDRAVEGDVLGNLGQAVLIAGEPGRAREIFDRELALSRASGDLVAEKLALEHLGLALAGLREPALAIESLERALSLARSLGDRQQEPTLLWHLAIQHAELGRRDVAIARASEAISALESARSPLASTYAEHLKRFRAADPGSGLGASASWDLARGGSSEIRVGAGLPAPSPSRDEASTGPGLLRMAVTAATSMTQFLIARRKLVDPVTLQSRLRTCAGCEHHTGLRCRVCGCFTNVKARMPHEACPVGKWPDARDRPGADGDRRG